MVDTVEYDCNRPTCIEKCPAHDAAFHAFNIIVIVFKNNVGAPVFLEIGQGARLAFELP